MLSEKIMPGTEDAENTLSLRAFIIAKVVMSLTEISQTNFRKASIHTRIRVFLGLLWGNFST
jgi:hypothetical protein